MDLLAEKSVTALRSAEEHSAALPQSTSTPTDSVLSWVK